MHGIVADREATWGEKLTTLTLGGVTLTALLGVTAMLGPWGNNNKNDVCAMSSAEILAPVPHDANEQGM